MSRKTKYVRGDKITEIGALATIIRDGGYIYWHAKPLHPSWVGGMPMRVLINAVRAGIIYRAILNT